MRCPHCHLENPANALRCDCGYEFARQYMPSSPVSGVSRSHYPQSALTAVGRWLTFIGVLAVMATGATARSGGEALWVAALLDLVAILSFPAGLCCWMIGALRDREARRRPR